jgi:hypothetical protein
MSTSAIADGWANFLPGTANHRRNEASLNGVNVKDYIYNNPVSTETLVKHNCLWASE